MYSLLSICCVIGGGCDLGRCDSSALSDHAGHVIFVGLRIVRGVRMCFGSVYSVLCIDALLYVYEPLRALCITLIDVLSCMALSLCSARLARRCVYIISAST